MDLGESGGWPHHNAFMNAMPAYLGYLNVAGLKWAGGFWNNIKRGYEIPKSRTRPPDLR